MHITLSLIAGEFVPKILGIHFVQPVSIAIENGLQNSTVSITVALTMLNNNEMAIISGLHAIWVYVTIFALAFWMAAPISGMGNRSRMTATVDEIEIG